ncbi:hypothetical protein [Leisingera caerulea]|uniref:hypothetical protein n=1 Tax=Leisingera caerulea TaxID=506591 RepID=UPI0012B61895|nr:hypothetical protein [Leisingera caerulea]
MTSEKEKNSDMLQVDGPIFGEASAAQYEKRCLQLLEDRPRDAHGEALRMALALGSARVQGITEALGDPFTHVSRAQHLLTELTDRLQAADAITSEDWRHFYHDGVKAVQEGRGANLPLLTSSLINLHRYTLEEAETLTLYLVAAGAKDALAETIASATVTAGTVACLCGRFSQWASALARHNMKPLRALPEASAEACRGFQAATLKRFSKIRNLDDIESAQEEQRAQRIALHRLLLENDNENRILVS